MDCVDVCLDVGVYTNEYVWIRDCAVSRRLPFLHLSFSLQVNAARPVLVLPSAVACLPPV